MGKNIYVGNLPYDTTGDDLVELFGTYGAVAPMSWSDIIYVTLSSDGSSTARSTF